MKALKIMLLVPFLSSAQAFGFCQEEEFVSIDAPAVTVKVQGRDYAPRCLLVKSGTLVTIQASSHHPLQGVANGQGPENPFAQGETMAPTTHRLTKNGAYGYFCTRHGDAEGNGMAGLVLVQD